MPFWWDDLDLTPPERTLDPEVVRYLHENFSRIRNANDTGWQSLTLYNSWVTFGSPYPTPRIRKLGNVVFIEGLIQSGTATAGTKVADIPAGYRPEGRMIWSVATNVGYGAIAYIESPSFHLQSVVMSAGWTSLNISYIAED